MESNPKRLNIYSEMTKQKKAGRMVRFVLLYCRGIKNVCYKLVGLWVEGLRFDYISLRQLNFQYHTLVFSLI